MDTTKLCPATDRNRRQADILNWACETLGKATADGTTERIRRFAEEAIELAHAVDLDKSAMLNLVEYVYARPAAE